MAEGGGDFGYDNPDLDYKIDHNDDDDEKEVDTTRQPWVASTPYQGGEQHEMQTMQHAQNGLRDTSYDETSFQTPLLSDFKSPEERQGIINWAIDFIKKRFPKVDLKN